MRENVPDAGKVDRGSIVLVVGPSERLGRVPVFAYDSYSQLMESFGYNASCKLNWKFLHIFLAMPPPSKSENRMAVPQLSVASERACPPWFGKALAFLGWVD